jgi:hypothetical protein
LEDRLRQYAADSAGNLYGVGLVDHVLNPEKARVIFSTNPNEQDGARLIYRGAMKFIRNPAMHKLSEYPENEAQLFISIIDSLLQLLDEAKSRMK